MPKQTLVTAVLCIGAAFVLTTPAHAGDIIATVGSYDSPDGYDYVASIPPGTYQNIGTFSFTIPTGEFAAIVTITGSFGNADSPATALSDYYLGYAGTDATEETVKVAECDSILANCSSGEEGPYTWSVTLTQTQLTELGPALTAGSIDFGYTWDASPPAQPVSDPFTGGYDPQYVYAGAATLDITPSPEPATVLFCFGGLAGLAAFRRFHKL